MGCLSEVTRLLGGVADVWYVAVCLAGVAGGMLRWQETATLLEIPEIKC